MLRKDCAIEMMMMLMALYTAEGIRTAEHN